MKLIPLTQWAALNGVHRSRAHVLVNQGRIKGAVMLGNRWFCPPDAQRLSPEQGKPINKARIKQNVWGNWNGYVGTRKVMEFGCRELDAKYWLEQYK